MIRRHVRADGFRALTAVHVALIALVADAALLEGRLDEV